MLTFETDGGFFSLINPSVRGAEPSPRPATPCPGREEASCLDSHIRPQRGWHPSRAPAPQRSRRIVYEVLSISTRRGRRARVEGAAAGSPQPWGCPRRALATRAGPTSEPWASWNVSAATASRRRPTTASPRRCRRSTSRRDLRVPQRFHAIDATRGRRTRPWAVSFPSLSLWKASGPSRDPTPPAGKRYKSPVAHVQEAR